MPDCALGAQMAHARPPTLLPLLAPPPKQQHQACSWWLCPPWPTPRRCLSLPSALTTPSSSLSTCCSTTSRVSHHPLGARVHSWPPPPPAPGQRIPLPSSPPTPPPHPPTHARRRGARRRLLPAPGARRGGARGHRRDHLLLLAHALRGDAGGGRRGEGGVQPRGERGRGWVGGRAWVGGLGGVRACRHAPCAWPLPLQPPAHPLPCCCCRTRRWLTSSPSSPLTWRPSASRLRRRAAPSSWRSA